MCGSEYDDNAKKLIRTVGLFDRKKSITIQTTNLNTLVIQYKKRLFIKSQRGETCRKGEGQEQQGDI